MNIRPWFVFLAASVAALGCGPFFYPAPSRLSEYPERFPVKTMSELLREDLSLPEKRASFDDLSEEVRAIAAELGATPRNELITRINHALEQNRTGEYRKRFANCLFDFRDLLEWNTATPEELKQYAEWRVDAMSSDDGFFRNEPRESWSLTGVELEARRNEWTRNFTATEKFLAQASQNPEGALTPHWLVQWGAWEFKHGHFGRARQIFELVAEQYPSHPRAEPALLMIARTYIEEWRQRRESIQNEGKQPDEEVWLLGRAADRALDDYLALYPTGRYAPDIGGWRAGLQDPGTAIASFLAQSDVQGHPEITRRAIRECEQLLSKMESASPPNEWRNQLPLEEIAKHPVAVLAIVYHFLDSESRNWFTDLIAASDLSEEEILDRAVTPVVRVRREGQRILPELAAALVKEKAHFDNTRWKPRYLCALAWAATEVGEHEQAARICDLGGDAARNSDDLLFVRAVALQRAGHLPEAITAFQSLRELHSASPLVADVSFRLAAALRDNHQAGLAFIELRRTKMDRSADVYRGEAGEDNEHAKSPQPPLHLSAEVENWADTLLQFAPIEELEAALGTPDITAEVAAELIASIGMRSIAREDFERALRFVPPAKENEESRAPRVPPVALRGLEWIDSVKNLQRLTEETQSTRNVEAKASAYVALAQEWASLRGRLIIPSLTSSGEWNSEFYESWRLRHANAQVAGHSAAHAAAELENRDELRHAYNYYLKAAETAPGTPLAATALWRANEALRSMAELSPWSQARAFETGATETSRALHQRIVSTIPNSPEARQLSVWWSFPPSVEVRWMPNDTQFYRIEASIYDALAAGAPENCPLWNEEYRTFEIRLRDLTQKVEGLSKPEMPTALATIRRDFLPVYVNARGSRIINDLDDLTAFVNEQGTTPTIWRKYFEIRLSDEPPQENDPDLKPWDDYLRFLSLTREKGELNPETQEYVRRPMSVRMREFLRLFPHSHKREAAIARLAVATVREIHGQTGVASTDWPQSPKLWGYWSSQVSSPLPKEIAAMFAALDDYDREFPGGRYSAEMRLWRGIASIDSQDWRKAVDLLAATLDDDTKRDLHLDAALSLAGVFISLLELPEQRQPIIKALRANRSAQRRLFQFIESDSFGARLGCMREYLTMQFAQTEP